MENENTMLADGENLTENLETVVDDSTSEPAIGGSDSSTEGGDADIESNTGAKPLDSDQQAKMQQVINDKVAKQRAAERELEDANKRIQQLQDQIPKEQRPNIPDMPDPFDDDFNQKVVERDKAIQEAAAFDGRQAVIQEQQQAAQQAAQQKRAEAIHKTVLSYTENAKNLGISQADLQAAGQTVAQYGVSDEVTQDILSDEKGPLITNYLAKNPSEMYELNSRTPMQAARYLDGIKSKLAAVSKPTNAPEPADSVGGKGTPPKMSPLIAGGKFS